METQTSKSTLRLIFISYRHLALRNLAPKVILDFRLPIDTRLTLGYRGSTAMMPHVSQPWLWVSPGYFRSKELDGF